MIAATAGRDYRVFAIGFLPGFPYAGYLPARLSGLARRESPRTRVPAGSVAIVGRQTAIYPAESPGGWHLIGRTPLRIVDVAARPVPDPRGRPHPVRADRPRRVRGAARGTAYDRDRSTSTPTSAKGSRTTPGSSTSSPRRASPAAPTRATARRSSPRSSAAKRRGVAVGAHPGYPDRDGFGRVERACLGRRGRRG